MQTFLCAPAARARRVALLAAGLLAAAAVAAQPALDAPPPLPREPSPADAPRAAGSTRPVIRLAAEPREADAAAAAEPLSEVPPDRQLPPARVTSPETRIDQRWQGNRIHEIVVTPAGSTRSYVIVNREGQRPLWTDELSAGLSTPRLLRLEF